MLKITGGVLLLVGMAAGAALVASPFAVWSLPSASFAAWVLFPGGFGAGALLFALGGAPGAATGLLRLCGGLLLTLAIASAVGLTLPMLGVLEPGGSTLPLWYVLALAGVIGTACALVPSGLSTSRPIGA
jgi:hypothetical protein